MPCQRSGHAAPAAPLPPWPGAGGAAPLPLRGPSARNPRHPGWGAEAFLFHCEEGTISLPLSLSLSPFRRGAAPFFTARNSFPISSPSHVPGASRVFLPTHLPPSPTVSKTIGEILGRDGSQLETCCAWPEDPSQNSCRFPKSRLQASKCHPSDGDRSQPVLGIATSGLRWGFVSVQGMDKEVREGPV